MRSGMYWIQEINSGPAGWLAGRETALPIVFFTPMAFISI